MTVQPRNAWAACTLSTTEVKQTETTPPNSVFVTWRETSRNRSVCLALNQTRTFLRSKQWTAKTVFKPFDCALSRTPGNYKRLWAKVRRSFTPIQFTLFTCNYLWPTLAEKAVTGRFLLVCFSFWKVGILWTHLWDKFRRSADTCGGRSGLQCGWRDNWTRTGFHVSSSWWSLCCCDPSSHTIPQWYIVGLGTEKQTRLCKTISAGPWSLREAQFIRLKGANTNSANTQLSSSLAMLHLL